MAELGGESLALVGENGAGKSTLIGIIAGLLRKSSGQVAVMGYDTVAEYRQARRNLGVVPQELVYDPFFTVQNMLRIQAGYFGCGKEEMIHVYTRHAMPVCEAGAEMLPYEDDGSKDFKVIWEAVQGGDTVRRFEGKKTKRAKKK